VLLIPVLSHKAYNYLMDYHPSFISRGSTHFHSVPS